MDYGSSLKEPRLIHLGCSTDAPTAPNRVELGHCRHAFVNARAVLTWVNFGWLKRWPGADLSPPSAPPAPTYGELWGMGYASLDETTAYM